MLEQGDIVLIPVPFTDLTSRKRRPAIVVSNDRYNRTTFDLVVVAMTSNPTITDHSFLLKTTDLDRGTLNRPGRVRVDKIYALSQSIVVKVFGRVKPEVLERIREHYRDLTS